MTRSALRLTTTVVALVLTAVSAQAGELYAALRPPAPVVDAAPLVFTAAPRESPAEGERIYGPLATYLSKTIGRPVIYRYPGSWGEYRTAMVRGDYDLVFDGPHFNGYRAERLNHEILVKLPEVYQFAIIGHRDLLFTSMQRLAGHTFCTLAPPNLGAQVVLDLYDNPARQPVLLPVDTWCAVYDGVVTGRCVAGVLPLTLLRAYDRQDRSRVLYFSSEMPHQALSAGPRLSAHERARLRDALTSSTAEEPTRALRANQHTSGFVPARSEEYLGLARYLRNEWGFY